MDSVILTVLCKAKSKSTNVGPWHTPRPKVPNRSKGVAPPGYAGLPKSAFPTAPAQLPLVRLMMFAGMPGKPQAILLLLVKIPSAGLAPLYKELMLLPRKIG